MLSADDILQPENVSYTDNVWTWAVAHMLHKGEDWQITTITDTAPIEIVFLSKGEPLTDYLISGNTIQDGTPTPSDPVDVVGVGERTKKLFDKNTLTANAYLSQNDGQYLSSKGQSYSCIIKIEPRTSYRVKTASQTMRIAFFTQYPQPNDIPTAYYNHDTLDSYAPRAFIETSGNTDRYMVVFCYNNSREYTDGKTVGEIMSTVMVSEGAEMSVPYEPYGFKLPPTVNDTEYPIYLGQVPTTRRIKKLVLTGEENWEYQSNFLRFILSLTNIYITGVRVDAFFITHFQIVTDGMGALDVPNNAAYLAKATLNTATLNVRMDVYTDASSFKQWLAAQYAAGTPMTVWYVLAAEETGIINEPLMKIGDYTDTISFAQDGVTIPTVAGTNTLTVDTTVQPSSMSITGRIREAADV